MPSSYLSQLLSSPAAARPVLLEGRWLGEDGSHALAARDPASVLEGGAEALEELPSWLDWHVGRHAAGAAIGYFSYELARFFESLPLQQNESLPDLSFAYYPRIEKISRPKIPRPEAPGTEQAEIQANFDEGSYAAAVERIRDYIAAGDIYQANLTQQFSARLAGLPPEQIYHRLADGHAPFRAFLKSPQRTIISNSPERFFHVSGGRILASPIKGTIARGTNPAEDRAQIAELLASEKDRAENLMIVDLLRNDLGRICCYESIQARLWEVETLPHLFHLASHIEGSLRPDVGSRDILRALFPCGSITGAPKIRAIEILAEIEKVPRGVSMGAIGVFIGSPGSPRCAMDFNVAIRTMTVQEDVAVFNVGGGVVYDSLAEAEHEEMMLKARPLLEALGGLGSTESWAMQACALEH